MTTSLSRSVTAILMLFVAVAASAATDSKTTVVGYITAFDEKIVTIESGTEKVEVPRSYIPQAVKAGEKVEVAMTEAQSRTMKHSKLKAAH